MAEKGKQMADHKYIDRKMGKNGKWEYIYEESTGNLGNGKKTQTKTKKSSIDMNEVINRKLKRMHAGEKTGDTKTIGQKIDRLQALKNKLAEVRNQKTGTNEKMIGKTSETKTNQINNFSSSKTSGKKNHQETGKTYVSKNTKKISELKNTDAKRVTDYIFNTNKKLSSLNNSQKKLPIEIESENRKINRRLSRSRNVGNKVWNWG